MVLVPGNADSEAGRMPPPEAFEAMSKFNVELAKAGVLLAADGLAPTSRGAKVRFAGDTPTVIDGPFTESKEIVAGFWIWECSSREEALEWLKRAPFGGGVEIELREIFDPEGIESSLPAEVRAANQQVRERLSGGR